jgi:hypothetical protein
VHYTLPDLIGTTDVSDQHVLFATSSSTLDSINPRYKPWGGNPVSQTGDPDAYNAALKDPLVRRSDNQSFPTNASSDFTWITHVHRGTPWQTIYLKSSNVVVNPTWMQWTGNTNMTDAQISSPINDWHLVYTLVWLLNTNQRDPHQLLSPNNSDTSAWREILDGMVIPINVTSDNELASGSPPRFSFLTISSNLAEAGIVASAVSLTRGNEPIHQFLHPSEVLGTPELSMNSPFLNVSSDIQLQRGITDEAYEKIPILLLPLLRGDSEAVASSLNGHITISFTGYDGYPYAIQISSNLSNWTTVNTNYPTNHLITFVQLIGTNPPSRYYRSVLLP